MGLLMQMNSGNVTAESLRGGNRNVELEWKGFSLTYPKLDYSFNTQDLIDSGSQLGMAELFQGRGFTDVDLLHDWYSCFLAEAVLSVISRDPTVYTEALQSDKFLQGLMFHCHWSSTWYDYMPVPHIDAVRNLLCTVIPVGSDPVQLSYFYNKNKITSHNSVGITSEGGGGLCGVLQFHQAGLVLHHRDGVRFISLPVPVCIDDGASGRYSLAAVSCARLLLRYAGLVPGGSGVSGPAMYLAGGTPPTKWVSCLSELSEFLRFCVLEQYID